MRILMAGTTYAPAFNGQAIFMTNLAEQLAAAGHSVAVLAPSEDGPAQESVVNGVQVVRPPTVRLTHWHSNAVVPLASGPVVDALFDRFRPQVVHIHDHYPLSWRVAQAARRRKFPVIGTNHFMPENLAPYLPLWKIGQPLYRAALWRWMLRLYNTLDFVTVQSRTAGEILAGQGLRRPLHLISCGVDLAEFYVDATVDQQAVRRRFGLHPTARLLLYVGRVDEEKRLDVLIHALARSGSADCHLAVGGRGAALTALKALVSQLGLGERVHFLDYVPDEEKRDLLNSADIFAMPSDAELLSIATLEAMACGRPILAARAQALPELVAEQVNGRLFRANDVDDAAAVLTELVSRPQNWPAMGVASRQRAESHGWPGVLAGYTHLYEEAIQYSFRIVENDPLLPVKKRAEQASGSPAHRLSSVIAEE
jgi:1,2-diacylglycerol 3-alpha-glucosyltransferase